MSIRGPRARTSWPPRGGCWLWLAALVMAVPAAAQAQQAAPAAQPDRPGTPGPAARTGVYERDVVEVTPAAGVVLNRVWVENRLGAVRIEGHDHPAVVITAVKRAPDAATLERLKVTLISDPSGPVRISTGMAPGADARPIPSGAATIDLVIRAPRSAAVQARVWNGPLALAGMENGAELHANHGTIDVQNASGHIVTHSAGGKQHFAEVFGAVDAQTLAGEMDLAMVRGDRLEASAHEGSILGRQVQVRHAWLRTIHGNIRLHGRALVGGHYRIGSYRGNIEVQLTSTGPLRVESLADGGTVDLPDGLRRSGQGEGEGEGTVTGTWAHGRGAPALVELRSRMGNIRFSLAE